ncbi:unnamed protein product [Penicillium bialowiezense]
MVFSSTSSGRAASRARLAAQIETREKGPAMKDDYWMSGDRSENEVMLENKGNINTLQRYRYVQYHQHSYYPDVAPKLLNTEEDLREVVQEELAIRERELFSDKNSKERFHHLKVRYWSLSQEWWRWRSAIQHGPGSRAFELWRSHPRWDAALVLVAVVRIDQSTTPAALGLGTARGFKVFNPEKTKLKELYKVNTEKGTDFFSRFFVRLSMFGMAGGSWKDPFELIEDAPPSYEGIMKDKKNPDGRAGGSSKA